MSAEESMSSPLPALDVYKRQIMDLLSKPQHVVVSQLDGMLKRLRFHRQRIPKERMYDLERFDYARAVATVTAETRDSFFECMETLVDRQSSDLVRIKALQIFAEFGAIEISAQGEPPFGQTALASLGNIMRSSPELYSLFIAQCLRDPFTDIVLHMTEGYLGLIARELAAWTRMKLHQVELAEGLGACAKKFTKVHQVLLDRVEKWWEASNENADEWRAHRDNNAFNAISEVIAFSCKSPTTAARYLPELPIRLYTKMDDFARMRGVYVRNGWVFSPFRLMAELAAACPGVAAFFAGPTWDKKVVPFDLLRFYEPLAPALVGHRLMTHLLGQLSLLLWEERDTVGEPSVMAYYIQTLFAIVRHSAAAAKEFLDAYAGVRRKIVDSQNRNGTLSFFAVQVLKRALEFAQTSGPLCNACVQGVVMVCYPTPGHEKLWADVREEMEASLPDVVRMLQDVCQKLLTTTADQQSEATKSALVGVISIMGAYSTARGALFNTEMVKGYSREQIVFRVLHSDAASGFVDDEVRLAAARCLVSLNVSHFQQQGIQQLLELFSSIPSTVSSTHYAVMCYLTYFMFKMALHDDDSEGRSADNHPGKVFRSLYAPEISATVFSLLERLVLDSSSEHASFWEQRFMQACVKFLMAGWVKLEFHADNLGPRPIDIISAIFGREQSRVTQLGVVFEERKQRYYRLIEQRRCVVSEDELTDEAASDNKSYKLPAIRLRKYADVRLSLLEYQHTFLEQTSLGARVANLYPALSELRRVDIVAFRILHQLANVVENITFVGSVHALLEAPFESWNRVDPGKPVVQCDLDEQPAFGERAQAMVLQGNAELVDVRPCTGSEQENKRLYQLHAAYRAVKLPQPSAADVAIGAVMPGVRLTPLLADDRNVCLVARTGREIVACVVAGPIAQTPGGSALGAAGTATNHAMVYGYCHDPELRAELRVVQTELMAVLSHMLYVRGFERCYFRADKVERQFLGDSGAILSTEDTAAASAAAAAAAATGDTAADGGADGGLEVGRTVFYWGLTRNIWRANKEHAFFVQNKITESLLQLLLDDQNRNRIEDAKRAGKIPSAKQIVKRFQCRIRTQMEEYGGQLTTEFEAHNADGTVQALARAQLDDDDAGAGFVDAATQSSASGRHTSELAASKKRFQAIVEREFKNGLVHASFRADAPVWEKVLAGSKEETLVEAMTRVSSTTTSLPQPMVAAALLAQLPPDLNPRTNPDTWPNECLAQAVEDAAREHADAGAGAKRGGAPGTAEARQAARDADAEAKRRRANMQEQALNRARDEREAEARRREWELPPLLQSWVVPSSAALLRMVHSLLTKGQKHIFESVSTALRTVPAHGLGLLEAMRAVLASFHYQLRASVLDALPAANYNVCAKILLVIEASLVDVPAGLEPALVALEYYELCLEVVKDVARILLALLESRTSSYTAAATQGASAVPKGRESELKDGGFDASGNTAAGAGEEGGQQRATSGSASLGGQKGVLDPTEERLMYGVCRTLTALMRQTGRVCLFKGSSLLISEGNRKCREHAQQQLFTRSQLLCDTVQAILLYDLEKENELDEAALAGAGAGAGAGSDAKGGRARSSPLIRDKARVYATQLLAYFLHVDPAFRYKFLSEFSVSSIKAERSLRASMVQQVLAQADMLRFQERLEPFLRVQRILAADEFAVSAHFVEHAVGAPHGEAFDGCKLLLITNRAYYISTNAFPDGMEQQVKRLTTQESLAQFAYLARCEFADIARLYRDLSGQVMAVRRYSDPVAVRLQSTTIRKQTDVFLHRAQGATEMILAELARRARDDAHRVHTVALDEVTPAALPFLFQECSRDKSQMSSSTFPRLMTHVHVVRRDKSVVKRVMMWVSVGEGGGDQFIVITPYHAQHWEPALAGEDDDEIFAAGAWEPSKVAKPLSRNTGATRARRGGLDEKTLAAKADQLKAMFAVPAPSALPGFLDALPSLPIGSFGGSAPFYFPVSEIQSVDFTEDAEAEMIVRIRRTDASRIPSVYIRFADDTGREMWRRELKKLFYSGSFGRWQENVLPDLSDTSRRKQELL